MDSRYGRYQFEVNISADLHLSKQNLIIFLQMDSYPDLLATSGECLKIYRVEPNSVMMECILNNVCCYIV